MAKKLSNKLLRLQVWWEEIVEGRADFTVEGAKEFAADLKSAVDEASSLEEAAVLAARVEAALQSVYADRDEKAELREVPFGDPPETTGERVVVPFRRRQPAPVPLHDGGAA